MFENFIGFPSPQYHYFSYIISYILQFFFKLLDFLSCVFIIKFGSAIHFKATIFFYTLFVIKHLLSTVHKNM